MFGISWFYLYGVGGTFYGLGTYLCVRAGTLDFKNKRDRRMYTATTSCLVLFAVVHGLFQFVLPYVE